MTSIKATYEMFLENGDIYEMNPDATGKWEKDKKWFTVLYNNTLEIETYGTEEI